MDTGDIGAYLALASMHYVGLGVEEDLNRAIELLEQILKYHEDSEILTALGYMLWDKGEHTVAEKMWYKAHGRHYAEMVAGYLERNPDMIAREVMLTK